MKLNFDHNGRRHMNVTRSEAEARGVPEATIAAAETQAVIIKKRDVARTEIASGAGDVMSLLGTTSDGAQLLFHEMALMAKGITEATTIIEIKAAVQPFADMTAGYLAKVDAGTVQMPFALKGSDVVITEIETRATVVTQALIASQQEEG